MALCDWLPALNTCAGCPWCPVASLSHLGWWYLVGGVFVCYPLIRMDMQIVLAFGCCEHGHSVWTGVTLGGYTVFVSWAMPVGKAKGRCYCCKVPKPRGLALTWQTPMAHPIRGWPGGKPLLSQTSFTCLLGTGPRNTDTTWVQPALDSAPM